VESAEDMPRLLVLSETPRIHDALPGFLTA
jgi:hypothetical protein